MRERSPEQEAPQSASWVDPALVSATRERNLSRLLVAYVSTGLVFMVFSVGSRVLPAFSGMKPLFSARLMFAALALLNCGCTLRVLSEALAYQGNASWAWNVLPVSALIELSAVVIFAVNLALSFMRNPIVPLRGN